MVETLEISTGGASTELHAGGTLQLSAVITPSNATNQAVTWSSSDKKVAPRGHVYVLRLNHTHSFKIYLP